MTDLPPHPPPPSRRLPSLTTRMGGLNLPMFVALVLAALVGGSATFGLTGGLSTLTQGLGFGALVAMAAALVLAARWRWLEALVGGPDRAYRAHRWFGYGAVVTLGLHWAMEPDLRLPETGLGEMAGGAGGEVAAVILVGLAAVSILRLVPPYRLWKYSHYAMGGPVFLLGGAFHAVFVPSALTGTPWQLVVQGAAVVGIAGGWLGTLWVHLRPTRPYRLTSVTQVPGGWTCGFRQRDHRSVPNPASSPISLSMRRGGWASSTPPSPLRVNRTVSCALSCVPRVILPAACGTS